MSADALYVLAVLALTVVVFVSDRVRLDIVALLATLALFAGGQIDAGQAVAGLGDSVVVLIAALFVVGEALYRTGVAHRVGQLIVARAGSGTPRLVAVMMVAVAGLSAFMSSTGAVAVFIPIALGLARQTGIAKQTLLMPLAVAAMIGGMLTLIGTPPNLVVTAELERAGLETFGFFDFTPVGLVILMAGIAWMALFGSKLLGGEPAAAQASARPTIQALLAAHELIDEIVQVRLEPASPLAGQSLKDARLHTRYGVNIAAVDGGRGFAPPVANQPLPAGARLLLSGDQTAVARLSATENLTKLALSEQDLKRAEAEMGIVEVLVSPASRAVGKTVLKADIDRHHGLIVHSVQRGGERVHAPLAELVLEAGDVLLLSGSWRAIANLERERPNLFVLRLPAEADDVAPAPEKASWALLIVGLMMVALTFGIVPSVIAVLAAALALVAAGCLDMNAAYRSINWQSIVLIAFMLPMAVALEQSGALALIVDGLVGALGGQPPLVLLAVLFVLTSLLSQVISNTATTVLLAPVALSVATRLDVAPEPLLMGVAVAASTAFSTPVASPVNTLVLGPGGYRFVDFVRVGVPLQLAALVLCLALLPLVFPF